MKQNPNTLLKNNIIFDLQLIIYDYLEINEVLYLFQDNHILRSRILNVNDYCWSTWNEIFMENYYYEAKYLLQKNILPDKSDLCYAIQSGNVEMLKLLDLYNVKFETRHLNFSAYEGIYDIFMYLIDIGVYADEGTLYDTKRGYKDLLEYNEEKNEELSTEGYLKIIEYLENK